ncbi:serine/threonine-protein kinase [Streptosporangium sp. NBC_01756]|uniref:serine/threonine-protein kinase n=1 Tax=Streptosporangium sp. NBC_01756 TaxID=2975950 RepID=UPI002DDB63FE|nr:serine/threonine-protein kinase [Streptosporangium sp. NBC_01756]WSC89281.1 serine/threonine protein kinase [Streptosporangium sp. NBC_01756]
MPEQHMRVLADRYELIAPLGRGTMGTVWRAFDRALGREVAIKEIRQESGLSEAQRTELRERMIREGRTAARISHPSVATVHDAIIENGSPWIIMELVQARSLEQVVEEEGPLPPRMVAEIGVDLLGALRAAHAQGVLHRDVKPGNVLITENGRVVLTDFGIAKAEGDTSLTKTGMVIGSPGYTAPERARGEHTGPESDLWSLGATLYFAVEGRPAYERSTVSETLAALMTERADPPVQAGPLRPVLEQLLERDHTVRLAPAQAAAMLRAVAETPSTGPAPAPGAPPAPRPAAAPAPVTRTAVPPRPAAASPAHPAPQAPPAHPAPPTAATAPVNPAPAPARADARPADEEFDADRTMMVVRPKSGLRLPPAGPPPQAFEPPAPPAFPGRGAPAGWPGTAPQTPATGPGQGPPAPPPQGFPDAARPGTEGAPGRGFAGPAGPSGAEPVWPVGPAAPNRGHAQYPGLGTDLFAIAGQGGKGEQTTTPARTRVGVIILMGVAAVALVVIVILAFALWR